MKFINLMMIGLFLSSVAQAAPAILIDEEWDGFSVPDVLASGFTHNIYQLPLEGAAYYNPLAWSGHYWPSKFGGINNRWADKRYAERYMTDSPSQNEIFRMSQNDLALLSPAEKFDILMGRYDYPLKQEVLSKASPRAEEWEGICHGWAPASINHPEPRPMSLRNRDGITVPFGSADIKGLLSYYYANHANLASAQIGLRCNFGQWTGGKRECTEDLNAGAFHIVMTNMLAIKHTSFVMDVDRWKEVWNQPVIGYRSRVLGDWQRPSRGAAARAVSELRFATEIWYVEEDEPSWNVDFGTENQVFQKKDYTYRVEVDANGMIVGGAWESDERPDFIWNMKKVDSFQGLMSGLSYLVRQ